MKNIDEKIKDYRYKKSKKFQKYIDEINEMNDFERRIIPTSYGNVTIDIYHSVMQKSPVYFNFHGGGFVLGYHELDGPYCKMLSEKANCTVINVDYLLAPEYKFPIPVYSSYEVITWCLKHADELGIDAENFVIGGHSAGGNLSAGVTYLLLNNNIQGQKGFIMDYAPCTQDIAHISDLDDDKKIEINRSLQYMLWYFEKQEDIQHPLASLCNLNVNNFPNTFMISAEFDPLFQGERIFKRNLERSHVHVECHVFLGCHHGFTHKYYDEYREDKANEAWHLMADFLIKSFHQTRKKA